MNAWTAMQEVGIEHARAALTRRHEICLVAPTGFGKTRISSRIAQFAQAKSSPWVFLTHRKFLFGQTMKAFHAADLNFGAIASEWEHEADPTALGQVCMLPTLYARKKELPPAKLVFVDERHANTGEKAQEIVSRYREQGARIVGLSATPVGLGKVCEELVIVAANSQARDVGAILPAKVYAPDEVDMRDIKKLTFSQPEVAKAFKPVLHQVVGSVFSHWQSLNPQQLPAIGFAPGVAESMWFVTEFAARGVRCAHIDGEKVYLGEQDADGEPVVYEGKAKPGTELMLIINRVIAGLGEADANDYRTALNEGDMREVVRLGSKHGIFKVVWNRFVLREGVDWPWLYHAIFATAFSDVKSWLQSVGRVLRMWPGYDHVLVQDHGGNCLRAGLGDPNADRDWKVKDTSASIRKGEQAAFENHSKEQAKVCPQCRQFIVPAAWRHAGGKCPSCGFGFKVTLRNVIQTDGELKPTRANAYKAKHSAAQSTNAQKAWDSIFWPSKKSKREKSSTFRQLLGRFHKEFPQFRVITTNGTTVIRNGDGTVATLRNVPPPESSAWDRRVKHVTREELQV